MLSKESKTSKKSFVVRVYPDLSQIKCVVSNLARQDKIGLQFSILGNLSPSHSVNKEEFEKSRSDIKRQLSNILENQYQFGHFNYNEIGELFIAGHLTPTFLSTVDGRELASLPAGLMGIFRELSIIPEEATNYFSAIRKGKNCLIIRGKGGELNKIKPLLALP